MKKDRGGRQMSSFRVELKKIVDDSYDIEIGYGLERKLAEDLKNGLAGGIRRFAVVAHRPVDTAVFTIQAVIPQKCIPMLCFIQQCRILQ